MKQKQQPHQTASNDIEKIWNEKCRNQIGKLFTSYSIKDIAKKLYPLPPDKTYSRYTTMKAAQKELIAQLTMLDKKKIKKANWLPELATNQKNSDAYASTLYERLSIEDRVRLYILTKPRKSIEKEVSEMLKSKVANSNVANSNVVVLTDSTDRDHNVIAHVILSIFSPTELRKRIESGINKLNYNEHKPFLKNQIPNIISGLFRSATMTINEQLDSFKSMKAKVDIIYFIKLNMLYSDEYATIRDTLGYLASILG